MATAQDVITQSLRLYGIIDQTEDPEIPDITNNITVLNELLQYSHCDGACQYTMRRAEATIPRGTAGKTSFFVVGPGELFDVDAVAIRSLWVRDIGPTINREVRIAPMVDIMRTTQTGMITRWHQERQANGSIKVSVWQPPARAVQAIIDYGARLPVILMPNDEIELPPEGIHDLVMLLGRRICSSYGRNLDAVKAVLTDSEAVHNRWAAWSRGQQWLRQLRA